MQDGSVGRSIDRIDGRAKVTGSALYVDDLSTPGGFFGVTVRSSIPHGTFRSLIPDSSFDWSKVVLVTAEDIPGENVVALIEDDQPALVPVGGTIRHLEEPLALIAAPTRELAREAAGRLSIIEEQKAAIFDVESSCRRQVVLVGEDNVFKELAIHRGGDVEKELSRCEHVIEGTYRTGSQEQMYIETQGMIATWDEASSACRVTGSMQCPYYVHTALKRLLGLPDDKVIVTQAVTGGGFGGKEEYPSMIAAHAALLARKAGVPVRMIYDRAEDIGATPKRHPSVVHHRLGLRADGTIHAASIDVLLDGGAYVTLSPVVLSRAILHASGGYRYPHIAIRGRVFATNNPPFGAFRGFGAPQTLFACERQIQKAADRIGMDAYSFRRLNMLVEGDVTATGQKLTESVGSAVVLDAAEEASRKELSRPPDTDPPLLRGKGLAFCMHGAGFTGSGEERLRGQATVQATGDGRFRVLSSSTDIGQGALTIFAQIAADGLGVDPSRVEIAEPTTEQVPDSGPTVASRTCMIVGGVIRKAAARLRDRLEKEGVRPGEVLSETVTYAPPPGIEWSDETYTGSAYPVYGWAACHVEVAVDPDTCEVRVERCIHAVDVGKAIHPIIVKGQIEGGTLQALGWALWENVVMEKGKVLNRRMTDCIIPTSLDAPEMETILLEIPYSQGPFGAKGVGEIPMDIPAAAIANAIGDALGVSLDEIPVLPERILEARVPTP